MIEKPKRQEGEVRRARPRLYGCVFNVVVLVGAAVVVFLAVLLFGGQFMDGIRAFLFGNQTPVIDTSAPTVLQRVRDLALLQTSRYDLEKVIEAGQGQGGLFSALTSDTLLFIAVGHVTAGVDLAALDESSFVVEGSSITMTLPPAQLLDCFLNEQASRVYDRARGLLAGGIDLETQARQAAVLEIRQGALDAGILGRAEAQALDVLETLFGSIGYETVTINRSAAVYENGEPLIQSSDTCFPAAATE